MASSRATKTRTIEVTSVAPVIQPSTSAIQKSKLVRKRLARAKSTPKQGFRRRRPCEAAAPRRPRRGADRPRPEAPAPRRPRRDADRPRPEAPAPRRRRRGAERPELEAPVEAPAPKRHRVIVEDELDPTTWRIPISWESAPRRRRRGAERPKRLAPVEAPAPKRHRAIVEDELDPTTWRIPISWERYRSANCTRGPLPLPSGSATDVFGPMSPICDNCLDLVRAGEAAWCRCTHCPAFEEEVGDKAPTTPPLRAA